MSLTTSYSNDQGSRLDDVRSIPKSYLNQQPKTSSYRSFGRELGNYDSKVDSTIDNSKLNTQAGLHHKENISTVLRASLSNENLLEKLSSKQTLKKEPSRIRERQNIAQRLAELDDEIENGDIDPVDIQKLNNPQYVVPYVKEIFANLRETEEKHTPKSWYMNQTQSDINDKMRAILVDWLVDVHLKFKLLPETLFLTINLIDRYLEKSKISRQKLQLVGVAAMLIAAKYEEIYPPEIKEFEYVTDRAYTKSEILDMEGKILSSLNFHLTITSPLVFLERYAMISKLDEKMLNMAKYLLELALVEYKMIKYLPSTLACSAIYLTNKIHKKEAWSSIMRKQADYSETELRPCAKDLCMLLQNATKNNLQAVRRKYSSSKYMQAAKIQLDKA